MIKSRRMRWAGHVAQVGREVYIGYWWESQKEIDQHGRGWIILRWILLREIGWDYMDWIDLAQYRNQWRALMNSVMNLWGP
jgi:hypothetical protein